LEYQLQQLEHNKQLFISLDANDATCFAVNFRSARAAWASRPHISTESISAGRKGEVVSTIQFNPTVPTPDQWPWVPRALVTYVDDPREEMIEMRAPMFL
jgi:hypothetical protein